MRFPKTFIVIGAAMFIIGVSALTVAAQSNRPMASSRPKTKQLIDELDQAINAELRGGCVEKDEYGDRRFCGRSKTGIEEIHEKAAKADDDQKARPEALRATALKNIRQFRDRGDLKIDYQATSRNPYRDDGTAIEIYVDDEANEYWIDPRNDLLVQMGPSAGTDKAPHKVGPEDRLPVSSLRNQAVSLIEAAVPGFAGRRSSLHPLEDNKGKQVYFFRWDDFSAPLKDSELPPFVQVGIYADGRLASFTNTLTP